MYDQFLDGDYFCFSISKFTNANYLIF